MKMTAGKLCPHSSNASLCRALVLACCLLSACTAIVPEQNGQVVIVEDRIAPLDYFTWMKNASEADLEVELAKLRMNASASDPVVTAVRTSMILSTSALADRKAEPEALALLKDIASVETDNNTSAAYKIFAEVLATLLQERQDSRDVRTVNQRALVEIDSLKKKNRQLQQQIEELTSIEQQIIEREQLNTREP